MLPLRDNIPTGAHGVRHVRADRGQRPRLLLLAARRVLARRPEQSRTTSASCRTGRRSRRRSRTRGGDQLPIAQLRHRRREPVPDDLHRHVHARRPAAPGRQHALPVDLRQQRRGRHGPGEVPRLLPAGRRRGARAAGRLRPELDGPDAGRLRRDRGGARRLHAALPARQGRDGDLHRLLLHDPRAAGAARARASGSSSRRCSPPTASARPAAAGSRTSRTSGASSSGWRPSRRSPIKKRVDRQTERAALR